MADTPGAVVIDVVPDLAKFYEAIDNLPDEVLDRLAAKVSERLASSVRLEGADTDA